MSPHKLQQSKYFLLAYKRSIPIFFSFTSHSQKFYDLMFCCLNVPLWTSFQNWISTAGSIRTESDPYTQICIRLALYSGHSLKWPEYDASIRPVWIASHRTALLQLIQIRFTVLIPSIPHSFNSSFPHFLIPHFLIPSISSFLISYFPISPSCF